MTKQEIIDKLTLIAQETFEKPNLMLSQDMSKSMVDTWTSMTFMQLLASVEQQFGFKFKMMEIIQLQTIGDIIQSIQNHIA